MEENFVDNYEHVDNSVLYAHQNIPGPGINSDIFETQLCVKCKCVEYCTDSCLCISRTGRNYSTEGRLLEEKMLELSHCIIECNYLCTCNRKCGNKLIQYGPTLGLDIFYHDIKGFSLRTLKPLKKGEFICEYAGEIIDRREAKLRINNSLSSMNYIFVLKEHSGETVTETIVDPTCIGNIGRYINHSCRPNTIIVPVRYDSVIPHLALFAICDIALGEEITFDYSGGEKSNFKEGKTDCHCGSDNCMKYIPFDPCLL